VAWLLLVIINFIETKLYKKANTSCLRYSRADFSSAKASQTFLLLQLQMQIIHRSVGEPAEGSLTRYPTFTNQMRTVIQLIKHLISINHLFLLVDLFCRGCGCLTARDPLRRNT
jgi:hypothetical protein